MSEEENILINPEDIDKERKRRRKTIVDSVAEIEKSSIKYSSKAGKVRIEYESLGKFSIPPVAYFEDFTVKQVNDITLSRYDDLLENVVATLNELGTDEQGNPIKIEDMILEEFFETLIGIKQTFNTSIHVHRWICDCQDEVPEKDKQINEENVDLKEINYITILDANENLKKYIKSQLERLSPEQFKEYLENKYQDDPVNANWSIEDEIETVEIKEPIVIIDKGKKFRFRFTRVKDLIDGYKMAKNKYAVQIKTIENKRMVNVPLAEMKIKKEEELKDVKYKMNKAAVLYARALSLLSVDGVDLNPQQKIDAYSNISRNALIGLNNTLNEIKFGIQQEHDFVCPICGTNERRSLQRQFNYIELLPLDSDTSRKLGEHQPVNIYFG